jgi:hypothetical protein
MGCVIGLKPLGVTLHAVNGINAVAIHAVEIHAVAIKNPI